MLTVRWLTSSQCRRLIATGTRVRPFCWVCSPHRSSGLRVFLKHKKSTEDYPLGALGGAAESCGLKRATDPARSPQPSSPRPQAGSLQLQFLCRALLNRNLLDHPVDEVRLTIVRVGQKADQSVVARSKVRREILRHSRLHARYSAQRLSGRWALHFFHPLHKICYGRIGS